MSVLPQEDMPWLKNISAAELTRVVEALFRVHRLNAAIIDLDALLLRIAEESRFVAQAEASSLLLYDDVAGDLYFRTAVGSSGDQETLKRDVRLKLDQGIAGAAATARAAVHVPDAPADPRFFREADAASNFQTRSLLAVPMLDRDRLVGVLEVVNKRGDSQFSPLDIHVMEIFSNLAATAIVNARLIEEQIRTERLAAIGQAVTGLSHYTKNIVTGLSGSAELIEMGLQNNNIDVLRRSFPVFRRNTKRISNFVQDMLSFSKPRQPLREATTLEAVVRDAVETFEGMLARRNIQIVLDLDQVPDPIYIEPQGLFRCFVNLLLNSADALRQANDGAIYITAKRKEDDALEIFVRDTGIGIPEDLLERIFDPFFSTKGAQGTGLGLAVTRKIIREHGGDIYAANAADGGAEFRVILPTTIPERPETLTL